MSEAKPDLPRRTEWEDYYSDHGIDIKRRYVELENAAYHLYRAECEEIGVAVRADTVEEALSRLVKEALTERGLSGEDGPVIKVDAATFERFEDEREKTKTVDVPAMDQSTFLSALLDTDEAVRKGYYERDTEASDNDGDEE